MNMQWQMNIRSPLPYVLSKTFCNGLCFLAHHVMSYNNICMISHACDVNYQMYVTSLVMRFLSSDFNLTNVNIHHQEDT